MHVCLGGTPPRPADSHLRSINCHTYTLPPDDGLVMPETCRGILIQSTKDKQCVKLVIIHIHQYICVLVVLIRSVVLNTLCVLTQTTFGFVCLFW
jgi:hypothetical protein